MEAAAKPTSEPLILVLNCGSSSVKYTIYERGSGKMVHHGTEDRVTDYEKALGNVEKMGRNKVMSVLKPAEQPQDPGLHFMDSSSAAAEMVTLCAAGGSVLHFFTTGQGNIIGNPIIPVMKISANPLTISTMSEHIDVDVSDILRLKMNLDEAADKVMEMMARNVNGRLTAAEALRHEEFVITKLYRSA